MRSAIISLIALLPALVYAQRSPSYQIEGTVVDKTTREPVPFASIGILKLPYGTSSNANGSFVLRIPAAVAEHDFTIVVSSIGFQNVELKNPGQHLVIELSPSVVTLNEVLVRSKDLRPDKIVSRAFSRIKKNYNTKTFTYRSFYRHYCNDDSVYGRLIEAAVDIYKRKGYRVQRPSPGYKEEVRVTQLRRSFDNTKIADGHSPIALYSVMGPDPVGYQVKSINGYLDLFPHYEVSNLRANRKAFDYTLDGITEYDGNEVYRINYDTKTDDSVKDVSAAMKFSQHGTLYISTKNYAIVRSEWNRYSPIDTIRAMTVYRKYNGKYYLHHAKKVGHVFNPSKGFQHHFHVELMTNEIDLLAKDKFKGREPGKEDLLKINYDSSFWSAYTILKSTPLEEKIASDLQQTGQDLDEQYVASQQEARDRYFGGKEDEEKFNSFLTKIRGVRPVYIDVWASWCRPCIQEMRSSKLLFEKYKTRVAFVYLSVDSDIEAWKKMIVKLGLNQSAMLNFRVGPDADIVRTFDINTIPRYILVNKKGDFVRLHAPRPSDDEIVTELDKLLAEP